MLTTSAEGLRLQLLHFKIPKEKVIEQFMHGGHIKQNFCMCMLPKYHLQNVTSDNDFCLLTAIDLKL